MITLRHTHTHVVLSIHRVKRVRSIIINYIAVLQMPRRGVSIAACGRVKRQKLTFDLSLLENVRGRNRSRRATNGRVGTPRLAHSPARVLLSLSEN